MSGRRPSEKRCDEGLLSGYSEPRAMDGSTLRKWILVKCREVLIDRFTVTLLWTWKKWSDVLVFCKILSFQNLDIIVLLLKNKNVLI